MLKSLFKTTCQKTNRRKSTNRLKPMEYGVLHTTDAFAIATRSGVTQASTWILTDSEAQEPFAGAGLHKPCWGGCKGFSIESLAGGVGTRSLHRMKAFTLIKRYHFAEKGHYLAGSLIE
jgi:hypothetical protein